MMIFYNKRKCIFTNMSVKLSITIVLLLILQSCSKKDCVCDIKVVEDDVLVNTYSEKVEDLGYPAIIGGNANHYRCSKEYTSTRYSTTDSITGKQSYTRYECSVE
ncbi:hypothetical protein N9242_00590 [Vicingaceae bacterium]|nr:hypothetical protein [Vicingaceae bacterium]